MPEPHDGRVLEEKVKLLSDALALLSRGEDLKRMILILKQPGWTTPAEFVFASSTIDAMIAQTNLLLAQKQQLMVGAQAVRSSKGRIGRINTRDRHALVSGALPS